MGLSLLLVLWATPQQAHAACAGTVKVLLYDNQSDATNGLFGGYFKAILLAKPGYCVDEVNTGGGAYNPVENWSLYNEVWDVRFNIFSSTCGVSAGWDLFDANWQAKAQTYLQNCGNLFIQSENSGFPSRNQGNGTFLRNIGAVTGPYTGCAGVNDNAQHSVIYTLPSTLPGAPNFTGYDPGGIPTTQVLGTSWVTKNSGWTTADTNLQRTIAAGWDGAAQMPTLGGSAATSGRVATTFDQSMFEWTYYASDPVKKAITDAFYSSLADWLNHTCPVTTVTWTPTSTQTSTSTPTSSASPTRTATDTLTASPSSSLTSTASPSPSPTSTPSQTRTSTATSTFTPTTTATSTATATPTATDSYTQTISPTGTQTRTPTATITFLDTFTNTATGSPTPTQTISSSSSPTQTPSATHTATRSNTATVSVTPSNSVTCSATPSATHTSTASPSASITVSWTGTFTSTSTPSASPSSSTTPTPSDTPTVTLTRTITETAVPQPSRILIFIYNSAGERVRLLFDGSVQYISTKIALSGDLLVTGQVPVGLDLQGATYSGQGGLSWDGSNDAGQFIASGAYYFKIEYSDNFGNSTALIKSVQVLNLQEQNSLEIFNSAGEMVAHRHLSSGFGDSGSMHLGANSMIPGLKDLEVIMHQNNGDQVLSWDGRNDKGAFVASGIYTLQWVHTHSDGARDVQSTSFLVLRSPDREIPGGDFHAVPNPVRGKTHAALRFDPAPGFDLTARTYNAAGELVGSAAESAAGGYCTIERGDLASGIYIVAIELRQNGALVRRTTTKLAILR